MNKVFISYSHKDKRWLDRLMVQLRPLEGGGYIELWADTRIKPGSDWKKEIESALAAASVAVLIVSADFLASEFIASKELPQLLRAAQQRACKVLLLVAGHCVVLQIPELARFQAINDPGRPLAALEKPQADEVLVKVAETIMGFVRKGNESGPSASEFVANQVRRLIVELEQHEHLSDLLTKELIVESLTGRDQLLQPLTTYLLDVIDEAQKNSHTSPQVEVLTVAKRFLDDCERARSVIVARICDILQNEHSGLVEVIVVADFSGSIARALVQLAKQNPDKFKSVEVCLVLSGEHFSVQGDTERWEAEFTKEEMARFYRFENQVPFKELKKLFEEIRRKKRRAMVLMGIERAYPQGEFLDWPGMGMIINIAKKHSIDVLIAAECYKVQPLLPTEVPRAGISMKGSPIELAPIQMGPGVWFVSDHAVHTANACQAQGEAIKCCYRFWRNRMEEKHYPIAVIFDLDGTILDSEETHKRLYQETARSLDYDLTDAEYFSKLRGMTDEETFKRILQLAGKKGNSKKLTAQKQKEFLRCLSEDQMKAVPGATEYIRALEKRGYLLAVATSASREEANIALRSIGLADVFRVLISSENVTIGKPAPEVYLKAVESLGLSPSECLVYEDAIAGIKAASAAQVRVIAVGDVKDESLRRAGAAMIISNFVNHELPELR